MTWPVQAHFNAATSRRTRFLLLLSLPLELDVQVLKLAAAARLVLHLCHTTEGRAWASQQWRLLLSAQVPTTAAQWLDQAERREAQLKAGQELGWTQQGLGRL